MWKPLKITFYGHGTRCCMPTSKSGGAGNSLLDESDNITVTDRLTVALSKQTQIFQILSIPRTVDTGGMIAELQELRSSTRNDARLRLIGGEIAALESLAAEGQEPLIVIKIWQNAAPNADRALLERASSLAAALSDNQIFASVMDDSEILHLCMIYAELGVWQEQEASPRGQISLTSPGASGSSPGRSRRILPTLSSWSRSPLWAG